jgi:hypothetical protein
MHPSPDRVGSCTHDRPRRRRHHGAALGRNKRQSQDVRIPHRPRRGPQRSHPYPPRHVPPMGRTPRPTRHRPPAHPARRQPAYPRRTGLQLPPRLRALLVLLVPAASARALPAQCVTRRTRPQGPHGTALGRAPARRNLDARAPPIRRGPERGGH